VAQAIPTGQWFTADEPSSNVSGKVSGAASGDASAGQHWWFDTGSVALDFAYSGEFGAGERAAGDLHPGERASGERAAAERLGAWLADRFPEIDAAAAIERDLADARALQRALATLSRAASARETAAAEDVDVINLFAATPDIPPALAGASRQAGRSRARVGQAFSSIARAAVELFDERNAERIRECAADDCHLIFYDESRSNNRRWCSMQRCGNRAKVRAHRSRTER
jgi:predicted RNA-binding Zn ribbon-like protein